MTGRRVEIFHHTTEQVSEHLGQALEITRAHELPDSTARAVLPQLLAMLSSKSVTIEQVGAPALIDGLGIRR